ncbi:MAG: hypothetical protein KAJ32_08510, partial [Gammaproteobacteria bacterium]|nr:hypothetical protein [Gammaproteobacteria bacterium]
STRRCSDGTTITTDSSSDATVSYSVASDGSFTLSDSPTDPQPLHGQILLDGNSLLMDSSLAVSSGALLMDIVSMKRVTAGTAPTYSNASLKGKYLFNFTEIYDPGTKTYCDQAGTLSFDGAGTAQGDGMMRCTDGSTVTTTAFTDTLDYFVESDGSFMLGGLVEPLHGQIALDGSSLLLDGTLTVSTATKLLNQGIAMKRVAKDYIGTWIICRDEVPFDEKEVHVINADGSTGTVTSYSYDTSDGSCSGVESLIESLGFTYTTGGSFTTTLLGASVNAVTMDVTIDGTGEVFYQIFYVDNLSAPDHIYFGDELADPLLDGSAPDKRPIALQETLPRLRQ